MRVGPRKQAAVIAVVLAALAATGLVLIAGSTALVLPLFVGQVLTLAVVAFLAVQFDRLRSQERRDRATRAAAERHAAQRHERVSARLGDLDAMLDRLGAAVEEIRTTVVEGEPPLTETTLRARLKRTEERLGRQQFWTYRQVESLQALYHDLRPSLALPPMGRWAAAPDLLLTCWRLTLERRPTRILECGSGVSTLVFAWGCRQVGHGRVIALDHDPVFAAKTRELLAEHGLTDWAEVRDAPLEPVTDGGPLWYASGKVPQGPLDLVLVDGPPAGTDPDARAPALGQLHARLGPDAIVLVDDHKRDRRVVDDWLDRYPDLEREILLHEKGTALLRRRGTA